MICACSEVSDQPGPPSLISIRCPHKETLFPKLSIEGTARRLSKVFVERTSHFVDFVVLRLKCDRTKFGIVIVCYLPLDMMTPKDDATRENSVT